MPDFRRPPEWQQNADRHTQLADPVLTYRAISRFDYVTRKPMQSIDHALVFTTADGSHQAYLPPHRPTRAEAAARRFAAVYEVDMGSHPVQLQLELPSDDDAFAFSATAEFTWRVTDPTGYVNSGERDVPNRLTREFQQLARPVTRRFPIEDAPSAERAVQQALDDSGGLAPGIGLQVTSTVRLTLDQEAVEHRRKLRALRYEGELLDPAHELRIRQQQREHELEILRAQQQEELNRQKIAFYQYHLQQGGVTAWALHLAEHPEDTRLVVDSLRDDERALVRDKIEVAAKLLGKNVLEDYQLEKPRQLAEQMLTDVLTQQPVAGAALESSSAAAAEPRDSAPQDRSEPADTPPPAEGTGGA